MSTDPREFEHPIDGTGGTVTPLADVIAGVLAEHQWYDATNELDGLRFGRACLIDDEGNETALLTETPSAHQARAVLAAISEAGAVEWATEHVAQGSRTIEIHPCDSEADAQGAIAYYGGRILSRIVGPWTAVEG